jgi:hypothetical protein
MPCSIHSLLIINEFHQFWMSCDCRRIQGKDEHMWAQGGAERHICGRPATNLAQMARHWSRRQQAHCMSILAASLKSVWSTDIERNTFGLKGPPACPLEQISLKFLHNRHNNEIRATHKKDGARWQPSSAERHKRSRPATPWRALRWVFSCMPRKGSYAQLWRFPWIPPTLQGYKRTPPLHLKNTHLKELSLISTF